MRLALFQKLSKAEQDKEVVRVKVEIQKAYKKLCETGTWHKPPKGFPKKIHEFVLWEAISPPRDNINK